MAITLDIHHQATIANGLRPSRCNSTSSRARPIGCYAENSDFRGGGMVISGRGKGRKVEKPIARTLKPRKPANAARTATPRLPQRAAGRERFAVLVDAVDALLSERDAGEISLYDIADAAGVPTASVYHFFPSMAAGYVALAQRYLGMFRDIFAEPIDHDSVTGWQDVFRIKHRQALDFYKDHVVARKLFLGSEYSWQVRQADVVGNRHLAESLSQTYARHFHLGNAEALIEKIEVGIDICDSIWALSCLKNDGIIDDYYAEESARAYEAYVGLYIPSHLDKRDKPEVETPLP